MKDHFPTLLAQFQTERAVAADKHLFTRVLTSELARESEGDEASDAHSGLRALSAPTYEHWLSATPLQRGAFRAWRYACNDDFLFAWSSVGDASAEDMAREAYTDIIDLMAEFRYPQLARVWHYIPRLNDIEGDGARYAAFCRGRRVALADNLRSGFCAATVIGTRAPTGLLLMIATRATGVAIENPRQTSTSDYPFELAQRPWFSRAMALPDCLFVSGTASIVGSESVNVGDAAAETREILRNMASLLEETNARAPNANFGFGDLAQMKVYLSNPSALNTVRAQLADAAITCPMAFFHGDICRAELTVEAEALFLTPRLSP